MEEKKIILFEPNAILGKVNQFCSRWASYSAVQFAEAGKNLKKNTIEVNMPINKRNRLDPKMAKDHFYLDPHKFTLLIFGGSQGASSINRLFPAALMNINIPFSLQVIHITGRGPMADIIRQQYANASITACVKAFEEQIDLAWSCANLVICRAGAATLAEQINFEVPAILIPFPKAANDHQTKNAEWIEKKIGGVVTFPEASLTASNLKKTLENLLSSSQLTQMQNAIIKFKQNHHKEDLSDFITTFLQKEKK